MGLANETSCFGPGGHSCGAKAPTAKLVPAARPALGAAVAAGLCLVSTARHRGSIRHPAAFTGIVG